MNAYNRALASIERQRFESWMDARALQEREVPYLKDYSLCRAIGNMAHERRTGIEHEVSQDLQRTHRAEHGGIIVPWQVFTRADIVGSDSFGGYLVETLNLDAVDALRPSTVAIQLGATVIPAPYGANVNVPRQTGVGTASWLTNEQTTITESDQVFGQIASSPHTLAAYTEVSRLLTLQAAPSPAEFVVRRGSGRHRRARSRSCGIFWQRHRRRTARTCGHDRRQHVHQHDRQRDHDHRRGCGARRWLERKRRRCQHQSGRRALARAAGNDLQHENALGG